MPGIDLTNATKHFDCKSIALASGEAIAQILLLNANGVSNALSSAFRAVATIHEDDPLAYRAKLLCAESMCFAWTASVGDLRFRNRPTVAQVQDLTTYMTSHFDDIVNQTCSLFERKHLTRPETMAFFEPAGTLFIERLGGLECMNASEEIKYSLSIRFVEGFRRRYLSRYNYYASIEQYLLSESEQRDAYEHCWRLYQQHLIRGFEAATLIGEEEANGTTLAQVYQPLRSIWEEWDYLAEAKGTGDAKRLVCRHLKMLDDEIDIWLSAFSFNDSIRLISGGPGSGKSTFSKRLASEYALKPNWRTLFVPLQRISGNGSLGTRIEDYFKHQIDEPFGTEHSPLSELGRGGHDWLIIFDGLDELAGEGRGSDNASQEFASALNDWKSSIGASSKARFIVLGRAPSMQDAQRRLGLIGRGTLYVQDMLPIRADSPADLIQDPDKIQSIDQRVEFWTRYATAKGLPPRLPEAMTAQPLADLTKEPLLSYLLILSGYVVENWEQAAENRNRIYQAIFQRIWERERSKPTRLHLNEMGKDTFEALLQTLGLAAWQGAGRTGDERAFTKVKRDFLRPSVITRTENSGFSSLENTAVLFYTRRDESGNAGFEFLHKSFGEYLTGVALVNAFIRWAKALTSEENEISPTHFLRLWTKISCKTLVDNEVLTFIRNEFRLQMENRLVEARALISASVQPFDLSVRKGFPLDAEGIDENFISMETKQIAARINLLAMIHALGESAYPASEFNKAGASGWRAGPISIPAFKRRDGLKEFIRIHVQVPVTESYYHVKGKMKYLVYGGGIATALLQRLDLENIDMSWMIFAHTNLSFCNLDGARISNSYFGTADFTGASLMSTSMISTRIMTACFIGANLKDADLSKSHLDFVYFITSSLANTKFGRCHFERVVMDKITFQQAILSTSQKYKVRAYQIDRPRMRSKIHRDIIEVFAFQPDKDYLNMRAEDPPRLSSDEEISEAPL